MYRPSRVSVAPADLSNLTSGRCCLGIDIPPSIMRQNEMQALWHETNVIICAYVFAFHIWFGSNLSSGSDAYVDRSNDLLSIKKEIVGILYIP